MNQRDISIIVGGVALGALLTSLFFKHRKSNLAMELEEDRRKSLPSMIILVRHGESEGNADHTLYRTTADNLVELTEHGSEDAKRTGKRIKDILGETKIHMIVSPFQRTLQTARNIRKSFESQIYHTYVDSRIREQEFGNLQGLCDHFCNFHSLFLYPFQSNMILTFLFPFNIKAMTSKVFVMFKAALVAFGIVSPLVRVVLMCMTESGRGGLTVLWV